MERHSKHISDKCSVWRVEETNVPWERKRKKCEKFWNTCELFSLGEKGWESKGISQFLYLNAKVCKQFLISWDYLSSQAHHLKSWCWDNSFSIGVFIPRREKKNRDCLCSVLRLLFSAFSAHFLKISENFNFLTSMFPPWNSVPESLQLFHQPSNITSWKPVQFTALCLHPTPHALCLDCNLHQVARCWMYLFRSLMFWGDSRDTPQD